MSAPKYGAARAATMGLSKHTKELLRKAQVKAQGGEELPIDVIDAETGEVLRLNKVNAVQRARLPEHQQNSGQAKDLLPAELSETRDKTVLIQMVKEFHRRQVLSAMRQESEREEVRRELLEREHTKWRRETMRKAFNQERLAAAEELRRLKIDQEMALASKLKELGMLGR